MRRNRNQHGVNQPLGGNGPLITNHLRDLDIELELLKRKRDIIQQEQDLLSRGAYPSDRQYDYQQPSVSYNFQETIPNQQQYNTNNYAQLYDGPSNSGNYRPQGIKRPFIGQVWQTSAKRFNGPKSNPWGDSPEQSFQHPQPKPVHFSGSIQGPRPSIKKTFQHPPRKQFQPNKVTKPKPQAAPNKLSTYPVEKTKKLVGPTVKPVNKDSEILRVDIPPTPQMKGRLELALGTIIKNMRQDYCTEKADLECFMSPYVQRMLKHTIRTRIHRLMLNQHVGAFTEIIAIYRNKYPKETDLELIKLARDARDLNKPPQLGWNQINADRPDEFFKKNMTKLIQIRLEDMFMKLGDMYKYNTTVNLDEYKAMIADKKENKEKENGDENNEGEPKTAEEENENDNKKLEDILGQEDGVQLVNEKLSKIKLLSKFVEELFEINIPKILPKFKDLMVSTLFSDKEFLSIKSTITARSKLKILKEITDNNTDETSVESENNGEVVPQEDESEAAEPTENTAAESTENTAAESTKNTVVETTENTATEQSETKATVSTPVKPMTPKALPSQTNSPASKDILYVKLIGRPTLPARAVIYDFLNKYNPVSIKKHKSLANLLVLGFKDKESFDKVLEANETVLGEFTLIIKASEQINPKKETHDQNNTSGTPSKSMNNSLADITCDIDDDDNKNKPTDESNDSEKANNDSNINTGENNGIEVTDDIIEATRDGVALTENEDKTIQAKEQTSDEKMDTTIAENNLKPITEDNEDDKNNESKEPMDKSKVNIKECAPGTPTRASSRLANATPRTITTRRSSKLAPN